MKTIGIALGDVTGIGPEVTLKALAARAPGSKHAYVITGDRACVSRVNLQLGLGLQVAAWAGSGQPGKVYVQQPGSDSLPEKLAAGAPEAARAAVTWLRDGAARCLRGELQALVTAPVNKKAIVNAGERFIGQTELLSEIAGTTRTAMMLLGQDDRDRWLRVALATTHVSIRKLPDQLTQERVERAIELAAQSCRDLKLPRARIAVCGLNPHAGEGGEMGDEEPRVIEPAVRASREGGIDAHGPYSADALFHYVYRGDYDAVVAMYHDQGLAPLKMVAFERGINWTLGLPFVRTSPDHGTAYDIAGRGIASPSSMLAALDLALQLIA